MTESLTLQVSQSLWFTVSFILKDFFLRKIVHCHILRGKMIHDHVLPFPEEFCLCAETRWCFTVCFLALCSTFIQILIKIYFVNQLQRCFIKLFVRDSLSAIYIANPSRDYSQCLFKVWKKKRKVLNERKC